MGKNATNIVLKIGSVELIGETNHSLSTSVDVIDVSSKASGRTRRILPGRVAENISFESLLDDTNETDYGYKEAHGAAKAGTLISFTIMEVDDAGTQVDGTDEINGSGYITSVTKDAPDNDRSTMSGTIEVDGDLTVESYSAV
jgi:hypothetical protein